MLSTLTTRNNRQREVCKTTIVSAPIGLIYTVPYVEPVIAAYLPALFLISNTVVPTAAATTTPIIM